MSDDDGVKVISEKFAQVEQAYEAAKRSGQEIGVPPYIAVHVALQLEAEFNVMVAPIGFLPEPRRTIAMLVNSQLLSAGGLFADARENLAVYRELLRLGRGGNGMSVHVIGPQLSVVMLAPVVTVPKQSVEGQN